MDDRDWDDKKVDKGIQPLRDVECGDWTEADYVDKGNKDFNSNLTSKQEEWRSQLRGET
ncbi:hypothetical protein KI387_002758, partial [Taxus chinensis]